MPVQVSLMSIDQILEHSDSRPLIRDQEAHKYVVFIAIQTSYSFNRISLLLPFWRMLTGMTNSMKKQSPKNHPQNRVRYILSAIIKAA